MNIHSPRRASAADYQATKRAPRTVEPKAAPEAAPSCRAGRTNPTVACGCGCGERFPMFDRCWRLRLYVLGHARRPQVLPDAQSRAAYMREYRKRRTEETP